MITVAASALRRTTQSDGLPLRASTSGPNIDVTLSCGVNKNLAASTTMDSTGHEVRMPDERTRRLEQLMAELKRVGVDPDSFSAGLAVPGEFALQVLRSLPDGAGPMAFLAALRRDEPRTVAPARAEREEREEPTAGT